MVIEERGDRGRRLLLSFDAREHVRTPRSVRYASNGEPVTPVTFAQDTSSSASLWLAATTTPPTTSA